MRVKISLLVVAVFLLACNPVRRLESGAMLLNKNKIRCNKKEFASQLYPILKQKPNRKLVGFIRFHLGVYTLFNQLRPSKINNWIKNTIGEEPVLYDSLLTETSVRQLKQFMINNGYFNAEISDTVTFPRKWKANVKYSIKTGEPYRLKNIQYIIPDPEITSIVLSDTQQAVIKMGQIYNFADFQKERERITLQLKNNGYYFFNQLYITFKIDSSLNSDQVDVFTYLNNPSESGDSINADIRTHKQYFLNSLYIRSDFDPATPESEYVKDDTIEFKERYFITHTRRKNFRPSALSNHIFSRKDNLYSFNNHEAAYRSLADMNNFRFVNITFQKDTTRREAGKNFLNGYYNLTPLPPQAYRIEVEGTHNGGNLGAAFNLVYTNRNTFRGAEVSEFRIKTAFEDQKQFTGSESRILWFNTFEIGPEFTYRLPRILPVWPFSRIVPRYRLSTPYTSFTASYNIQNRPEYFKRVAGVSAGFAYKRKWSVSHQILPVEINFVNVKPSPLFKAKLDEIGDPALTASYGDYLIADGRYSIIINTQQLNSLRNFIYFRFNFETAGNLLRLIDRVSRRVKSDSEVSMILKSEYAQYVKPDFDFRYYYIADEHNNLVYRLYAGLGIPYMNSKSLPFEKSYFAGGANDLRAFVARSVGPGSFDKEEKIQQSGEIKINSNIEYRFDLIRVLEGAFFIDAGNVWLFKEDPNRPGSKFETKDFISEIAVGGGYGFRFNFNYFIFRIDLGYQFRDPRKPASQRWVYDNLKLKSAFGNFAIGYPF
ncbi:MAG: BamA/TamA family outer membrane protein [Bacteroidia bacterium]|nr:BamA/TamA family outer membrane protein [Bacteroidia bacterium]MCZ2277958.1 BamA/TamA family outer membrane protein [Bacteroidia bacterium]